MSLIARVESHHLIGLALKAGVLRSTWKNCLPLVFMCKAERRPNIPWKRSSWQPVLYLGAFCTFWRRIRGHTSKLLFMTWGVYFSPKQTIGVSAMRKKKSTMMRRRVVLSVIFILTTCLWEDLLNLCSIWWQQEVQDHLRMNDSTGLNCHLRSIDRFR